MNVLFVPSLGVPDSIELLNRLSASIDHPIQYKCVLNNGITGILESWRQAHPDWIVREPVCGNMGCSGAWNWAAKMFNKEPSIFIINEDAWLMPGYLRKICETADANPNAPMIHCNSSNAYYAFVWPKVGREAFGAFDENLFPGYYNDCDMRVRHRLCGVTSYPYALEGMEPLPHGKPRTGGINYASFISGCGLLNRAYWKRKWGSLDFEKSEYQTPYKDHRLTIKDIVWYPEHRAELWPLWREFINQPNPSIYD